MKKGIWICALFLLIAPGRPAFSQDNAGYAPPEHGWAVLFQADKNFNLTNFDGSSLSVKLQTSARTAWRAGAFYSYEYNTGKIQSNFRIAYIRYLFSDDGIHAYTGLGPSLVYNYQAYKHGYASEQWTVTTIYDRKAGIFALFGAEWFATRQISFVAEYAFALEYQFYYRKDDNQDAAGEPKGSTVDKLYGWLYGSDPVRFGITVYF